MCSCTLQHAVGHFQVSGLFNSLFLSTDLIPLLSLMKFLFHNLVIYKLDRKDGSCDVLTMDWLLNPKFLPTSRNKRRRHNRDDSDEEESDDEASNQNNLLETNPQNNNRTEIHSSEVDYGDDDNMMYAPIRRTLPLPLSDVPSSKSNTRARRSNLTSKESGTGAAMLTTLRSFANIEAAQLGAGVRLFVQACVLSGCDYVPNRLSKVGPVTAFKLVKDASHRQPGERFDRVMKSLPKGSVLQKEPTDGKANDEEANADEDINDFLSCCSSYSEMKEKYLELLSKSEAVFYYHLVKELTGGCVVPLMPHKPVGSTSNNNNPDDSSPSIDNFDSDLSFIGSAEEALKNQPMAAPPCPRNQPAATANQNSTGWITTKRPAGIVKNTYNKQLSQHQTNSSGIQPALKGTLQYSFNRHNNAKNLMTIHRPTVAHHLSSRSNTTNQLTQMSPLPTNAMAMPSAKASIESNPFSSFAHDTSKFERMPASRTTTGATPSLEREAKTKPSPSISPFLSPMGGVSAKFDYAEASVRKECNTTVLQSDPDMDKLDAVRKDLLTDHNNDEVEVTSSSPTEVADDISSKDDASPPRADSKTVADANDNNFDYDDQIIPESPPIETSKYFGRALRRGSPRRISTSPDKFYPYNQGSSPDNAINLTDDPNSDSESPKKPIDTFFESQTSIRSNSSANKRPFKSPYPNLTNPPTARKKPRPVSSGALLAGFAIQRERNPVSSLGGTQQRMAARTANNRLRGTVSIQNFLKPSSNRK